LDAIALKICSEMIKQTIMAVIEREGGRDARDRKRWLASRTQRAVSHKLRT
jgi:hypothetical protein